MEVKKAMYVDGHEREDVVAYRKQFLTTVLENESCHFQYEDADLDTIHPKLFPHQHLHVPIFHDESIFRSNELRRRVWLTKGKMPLRKKGNGRAIHVSDFIVEETG